MRQALAVVTIVVACSPSAPGSVGPTPGGVACGAHVCAIEREGCCALRRPDGATSFTCVARPSGSEPDAETACAAAGATHLDASHATVDFALCDEPGDCAAGERCVTNPSHMGTSTVTLCASRGTAAERCRRASDCAPGMTCRSSPADCVLGGAYCDAPRCLAAAPRVACGDATCEGGTPVCCVGGRWGAGKCAAPGECERAHGEGEYACMSSADCGAARECCFAGDFNVGIPPATSCMLTCFHEAMNVACVRDTDCKQGSEAHCKRATASAAPRSLSICSP